MALSLEEIEHFEELARQFSKKSIIPMFEGEFSDGNPELLPEIIKTAFEIGIASSPDRAMAGRDYGIWGSDSGTSGLLSSILLLTVIAESCGGIAMSLNAQGVATNLLLQVEKELPFSPVRVALCFQEGFTLPYFGTIFSPDKDLPASISTEAEPSGNGYTINGTKSFVYSMADVDAYVVLARIKDKWGCFAVTSDAEGLTKRDAGHRSGLRACELSHIDFKNVQVLSNARIDSGDALDLVIRAICLNWAGMTAIAAGVAKGAAASAREYAAERYQGGKQIEEHPAIKMLIADSEARARAAESSVFSLKDIDPTLAKSLKAAAMVKLTGMELCARAVTDCLQIFGGYGYMEDFGMEKRLRDAAVLKSASGPPNYLKQLIFDIEKEGVSR